MKFCKTFYSKELAIKKAAKMKTKFVQVLRINNYIFVQNYKEEPRPWIEVIFEGRPKDLKTTINK